VGNDLPNSPSLSLTGGAEPQEDGWLARAWTDCRSEGVSAPTLRWSAARVEETVAMD